MYQLMWDLSNKTFPQIDLNCEVVFHKEQKKHDI